MFVTAVIRLAGERLILAVEITTLADLKRDQEMFQ